MSLFVFIVLIAIGASFLAAGLIMLASIMASHSTARLAEQYPEIYSEEALAATYHRVEALRLQQEGHPSSTQIVAH